MVALLEENAIDHALIGAAAMAIHGVSRATADVDLFTMDGSVLQKRLWAVLQRRGAELRLLKGDMGRPAGRQRPPDAHW